MLRLICADKSNAEIGELLGIRLPTVKTHVSHILQKLDVSRRSEAIRAAQLCTCCPAQSCKKEPPAGGYFLRVHVLLWARRSLRGCQKLERPLTLRRSWYILSFSKCRDGLHCQNEYWI